MNAVPNVGMHSLRLGFTRGHTASNRRRFVAPCDICIWNPYHVRLIIRAPINQQGFPIPVCGVTIITYIVTSHCACRPPAAADRFFFLSAIITTQRRICTNVRWWHNDCRGVEGVLICPLLSTPPCRTPLQSLRRFSFVVYRYMRVPYFAVRLIERAHAPM